MSQETGSRSLVKIVLAVVLSFLLYLTGIGTFFYILPLLMLDRRYPKRTTDTACVAALVLVLGRNVYLMRDVLDQVLTWAFIGVSMFMPLSLMLGAMVWVSRDNAESLFERVLFAFCPSVILFVVFELFLAFSPQTAAALVEAYSYAAADIMTAFIPVDVSTLGGFIQVLLFAIVTLVLPIVFVNFIAVTFIYEACTHPGSEEFENSVRSFRVPEWFLYLFLSLWALVLVFSFVSVPLPVVALVLTLALAASLMYGLQGFAILCHGIHSRGGRITSFKLACWLFMLILVLQVVNIILILLLCLLGVLENWVRLRKPGEFSNEDHS